MLYSEVSERLQKLINKTPTQADFMKILGLKQSTISERARRNSKFSPDEITKLNNHYGINLYTNTSQNNSSFIPDDKLEINYWSELPDELKNPKIRSVWFDKEIINNAWNMSADNLIIVPMIGDALSHYWYPIYGGDMLIVDTSQNSVLECGLYFATSQNNSRYWIREIDVLANETIEFRRYSSGGKIVKTYTRQELLDVDFKIIGKVIKNVSFRL